MSKLLSFLSRLVDEKFYGEVTIHFKDGKLGLIHVKQDFLETTLPAPPPPRLTTRPTADSGWMR